MKNTGWNPKLFLELDRTGLERAGKTHLALSEIAEVKFIVVDGQETGFDSDGDFAAFGDILEEVTGDFEGVLAATVLLASKYKV